MSGYDRSRKQLVVAMDHARAMGAVAGLEDPGAVIDLAVEAGADAIMTSYGVIKRYKERLIGRIPTFLRVDGGPSFYREDWLKNTQWRLLHTVEDAESLGVDGVCTMVFMGSEVELETLAITADMAGELSGTSMTLMVEALPCPGERIPDPLDAKAMADACRLAFEHGADVLKTYATGSAESFRLVTENSPNPVLIAGGARMDSDRAVMQVVRDTLDAGGRGVVFGRNIWQSPDPAKMIRALRHLIHEDGLVDEALTLLD
ncbi:MAG: fructose-bisphosphate aldolase [Rhizobiales bacterium]|nr:fructose-bisphosphate aldolase [Hyphomicrobiales bacterium]